MLNILRLYPGIYFIKQHIFTHPLSVSNGFLFVPEKIGERKTDNNFSKYRSILMDTNLEPKGWLELKDFCMKESIPTPDLLIMTHCHLDHSSHAHDFLNLFNGSEIICTAPEVPIILEDDAFFNVYEFHPLDYLPNLVDSIHYLKYDILKYEKINDKKRVLSYNPGDSFDFGSLILQSIPLTAHSSGHSGFLISIQKRDFTDSMLKSDKSLKLLKINENNQDFYDFILHTSCLGLDRHDLKRNGFGPWYGFRQNSISKYLQNIEEMRNFFKTTAVFLTSSHGFIYSKANLLIDESDGPFNISYLQDASPKKMPIIQIETNSEITEGSHDNLVSIDEPFDYLRNKILTAAQKFRESLEKHGYSIQKVKEIVKNNTIDDQTTGIEREILDKLSEEDIIFPKDRIPEKVLPVYIFWERWFLINHLKFLVAEI